MRVISVAQCTLVAREISKSERTTLEVYKWNGSTCSTAPSPHPLAGDTVRNTECSIIKAVSITWKLTIDSLHLVDPLQPVEVQN